MPRQKTNVSSEKLILISDTAWSEGISNITVPMDILLNGTNEQEFRIGGDEPFIYPEYGGSVVGLFL